MSSWWNPLSWWGGAQENQEQAPQPGAGSSWSWWNPMSWMGGGAAPDAQPESQPDGAGVEGNKVQERQQQAQGERSKDQASPKAPAEATKKTQVAASPIAPAASPKAQQPVQAQAVEQKEEPVTQVTEKRRTVSISEATPLTKNDGIAPRLSHVARDRPPALKKRTPSRAHLKERKSFQSEETITQSRPAGESSDSSSETSAAETVTSPPRMPSGIRLPGMGSPGGMSMFNPAAVKLKSVSRTPPKEKVEEEPKTVDFRSMLKKTPTNNA